MAHFIKSDIEDKKIDELFEKIDDIDLDEYQEKLTAGTGIAISDANVISANIDLSGYQEKLTAGSGISIDADNVISSTASGGTQLYLHHITSSEYGSNVFDCMFVTKEASYSNISAQTDTSDFIALVNANINHQNRGGTVLTDADSKYLSFFTSVKFPKLDDPTTSISDIGMIYVFFLSFSPTNIYKPSVWGFSANFNAFASTNIAEIDLTKLTDTVTAL